MWFDFRSRQTLHEFHISVVWFEGGDGQLKIEFCFKEEPGERLEEREKGKRWEMGDWGRVRPPSYSTVVCVCNRFIYPATY